MIHPTNLINVCLTKVDVRLNNFAEEKPKPPLQNKGEFTKFQILLEIMRNQPHIPMLFPFSCYSKKEKRLGLVSNAFSG